MRFRHALARFGEAVRMALVLVAIALVATGCPGGEGGGGGY